MRKKFMAILTVVCVLSSMPMAALAKPVVATDGNASGYAAEVQESSSVLRRERGTCSQVYSRAWCNAHGYANNRPVGASVITQLNQREKNCLLKWYGSEAAAIAVNAATLNAAGLLASTAQNAFNLWLCLA